MGGLSMPYKSIWGLSIYSPTGQLSGSLCVLQVNFEGLSLPHTSIFWVDLCPSGEFVGAYRSLAGHFLGSGLSAAGEICACLSRKGQFFGACVCPVGKDLGLSMPGQFLGSVYALQVNFWGLSVPYRSVFGSV